MRVSGMPWFLWMKLRAAAQLSLAQAWVKPRDGHCRMAMAVMSKPLKSVAKVEPMLTFNHLFNQRWEPEFLEGDNRSKFVAYLKTFVNLGIHHVQGNVIDDTVLKDAQEHPENYESLVVRVAGFSAYFTDMHREVQDQIIARTKQRLI